MHANLNKTASKTLLLLLLPKDEGKARKPRTFLHNLLKIRGAQTMQGQGAREGGVKDTQGAHRAAKLHEMCFYFAVQHCAPCTLHLHLQLHLLPACPPKALSFGLCAFIFHLHEFFIVFPDAKRKRSELHFTLRGIRTNTRYLSVGNQLENQLAAQTIAPYSFPYLLPPRYTVA